MDLSKLIFIASVGLSIISIILFILIPGFPLFIFFFFPPIFCLGRKRAQLSTDSSLHTCPHCGKYLIEPEENFCPHCGIKIK